MPRGSLCFFPLQTTRLHRGGGAGNVTFRGLHAPAGAIYTRTGFETVGTVPIL